MKIQALILGASIGVALAFVPSCGGGGSSACNATNCADGCCTATNMCDRSHANNSCGTKGAACVNCAAMSQACNAVTNVCSAVSAGGGSGSTGGGSGSTGGGSGSTGGGSGSTGGGSGSTGGGSGSTGGGSGSTGGGSGSTGGGSGSLATCNIVNPSCATGTTCMFDKRDNTGQTQLCFPGDCDLADIQTCSGATPKCDYGVVGTEPRRVCVAAGNKTLGQSCTVTGNTDDCGAGMLCYMGKCLQYCHLTDCPVGYACTINLALSASNEIFSVCDVACDLFAATNPCAATEQCTPTVLGNTCLDVGTVATGAACTNIDDCVRGSTCIPTDTSGNAVCAKICNVDGGMPNCGTGSCQDVTIQEGNPLGVCN